MKKIGLLLFLSLFCNISYSQNPCPNVPTVVYAGKTYHTVAIGDQCWLKENLDLGIRIGGLDSYQTNNGIIEKFCWDDDPANCTIYGGLYTWKEAMQYVTSSETQGICPTGWHIPDTTEFKTLSIAIGGDGNSLKAVGQGTGAGAGTDSSGFSAMMASMNYGNFYDLGEHAYFWSSMKYLDIFSYLMVLKKSDSSITLSYGNRDFAMSVRCLNDLSVYDLSLMPVELGLFTAIPNGRTIQLNWDTKTEKNSNKFDVERETIGTNWVTIGSVKAAVLSNSPKQYSYSDKNLQSGKYQYRLKMIDNDGTFEYSKIIETEVAVPQNYELNQNFPNPFNPNTVISYSLPSASNVKLIVFNSLGQTVKVLENGFKNAGTYSVNFNAAELPSGTYFYKIEAGQFSQIKKMILLK